jgi:hypothetical protein
MFLFVKQSICRNWFVSVFSAAEEWFTGIQREGAREAARGEVLQKIARALAGSFLVTFRLAPLAEPLAREAQGTSPTHAWDDGARNSA